MSSGSSKKKKSGKKNTQHEGSKPATVNGTQFKKSSTTPVTEEKPTIEQIIPEPKPSKSNSNNKKVDNKVDSKNKKNKANIKKKSKKVGCFSNWFSTKNLFLFYIFAVLFWCNGKTHDQCNSYEKLLCFNGLSQYILNHDLFHKYVEPKITFIKQNVEVYGKQTLDTVSVHYGTHAKPHVDPLLKSAQPHFQNAREISVEYVYIPVTEGLTKAQVYYDENAKDHVNYYYNQAQEHASYAYEQALEYNKNTVQPLYNKKVVPLVIYTKDKVLFYYDTKVVPFTYRILAVIERTYHEKIVPVYRAYIEPHVLSILELIRGEDKSKVENEKKIKAEAARKAKEEADRKARAEAERKVKAEAERKVKAEAERKAKAEAERKAAEAERKAKAEAERKAKEEADRKAKEEADRKAKEEADRKAKEEAERKAKEEADRKAKEEAERKAKEEAERKAKEELEREAKEESERKVKEAAERKAKEEVKKAFREALHKEHELFEKNVTLFLQDYEKKATHIANETLNEVEARILALKSFGSKHLAELKKFAGQIKDNTEDSKSTKLHKLTESAKNSIDDIKKSRQEFTGISTKSYEDLEEVKFEELKKEFDIIKLREYLHRKENVYSQVDESKVDDKLRNELDVAFSSIMSESNELKNEASLRVREIFKIINKKIDSLKSTEDGIIKDISDHVKIEKENLKDKKSKKDDKENSDAPNIEPEVTPSANKNDNQVPVQVVENPPVEKKASKISPVTIQHTSSDPILEKLKAQRDLVLYKLMEGYKLFKANKGNDPVQSKDATDDDEDEEYGEEGEDEIEIGDDDEFLADD